MGDTRRTEFTRAQFLRASSGAFLMASPLGCDLLTTQPAGGESSDESNQNKGRQAPMLADRVDSGDLPPVEDRLPDEPLTVEVVDSVGNYGGQWETMINGPTDYTWIDRTVGYETLVRWDPDFDDIEPNLAESFETNEDGSEYTFHLRPGVKWSDGEPFTADDIVFAQNDIAAHEQLGGDDGIRAEKIDEHTVKLICSEPNSLLPQEMASTSGLHFIKHPKHYLQQFHAEYNPDADAEAESAGYDSWVDYFDQRTETWENPDLPTLNGWILLEAESGTGRIVVERNPYYWKVDPDGSQLPYIDRVLFNVVNDPEAMVLDITNGDVDMHARHVNTPSNKPVLAGESEESGYRIFDAPSSWMNTLVIALNLTAKNPSYREMFNIKDFRIGLSHAINREEIIETVYQRTGEPWQAAPRPEADFFHEQLATQYLDYDEDVANEHLDRAGFSERDGEGFRLGPDGERIAFGVDVKSEEPEMVDTLQLVRQHWEAVGIEMRVNALEGSFKFNRGLGNEHVAVADSGDGGLNDAWLDPRWYLPFNAAESTFAIPWAQWFDTAGDEGEEPPQDTEAGRAAHEQMELYRQLLASPDEAERVELLTAILDIAAETFWAIGISLPEGGYGIVKNSFHNVPESMPDAWIYPTPGPTHPEQYYISR